MWHEFDVFWKNEMTVRTGAIEGIKPDSIVFRDESGRLEMPFNDYGYRTAKGFDEAMRSFPKGGAVTVVERRGVIYAFANDERVERFYRANLATIASMGAGMVGGLAAFSFTGFAPFGAAFLALGTVLGFLPLYRYIRFLNGIDAVVGHGSWARTSTA